MKNDFLFVHIHPIKHLQLKYSIYYCVIPSIIKFRKVCLLIMTSKRIEWVDAYKGFGIFFVTFAHLSPCFPIEKHIYSFHMFLFYFLSGYIYKSSDVSLQQSVCKRAKSLLLPFLFWDISATIIEIIVGKNII